jgi:excisionase family DNA binding protein
MSHELYSIEQVAERLALHVRTVRNYVRAGRLRAVRIGKQYRIARVDLEAFTGRPASELEIDPSARSRHVEISSIVQIDAVSPKEMNRVVNLLMGAAKGRQENDEPLRIETIYDEARARLKVIIVGGLRVTGSVLKLIAAAVEV